MSDAFGNFGSVGCSLTTGTSECNPGNLEQGCYQFDEKIEDGAMAYWAYNAVKGAHDKIAMMREKNFFSSFSQSLSLGRFVQDFDASELRLKNSLFDILSWVGYAMILIANFMPFLAPGAIPLALAAATGSSIGLATLAGSGQAKANNPEPDSQEEKFLRILDLEAMLQEFFDGTRQHLEKVARLAVGVKYEGDEYSDLPSSEDVDKEWRSESLSSSVAHFYSNPIWLIDNNAEHFDDALELAGEVFRLKLIDRTLQLSGWVVGVDETAANKETCEQRGASRWMEIEGKGEFCVSLLWMEPGGEAGPKLAEKGGMTENALKTHKMIDLEVYYNEAIRCSRAGRSGTTELDVADIDRSSKEIPLCYFSMPVYTTWIGLCTVVPPVGPAVQNGRRCREAREMDWDEKPADVQVQYCKDPKWKNGCEIYTVAVNKCRTFSFPCVSHADYLGTNSNNVQMLSTTTTLIKFQQSKINGRMISLACGICKYMPATGMGLPFWRRS